MNAKVLPSLLKALVISATCAAMGCAPQPSVGSADLNDEGLFTAAGGKADGVDPVARLYNQRAFLSDAGIVVAEPGVRYADTMHYSLPAEGVNVLDGFIDSLDGLGIPEGSYTQLSVFRIHKTADQFGYLRIDHPGAPLSIRIARRNVGSSTTHSEWANREPIDLGNVAAAADFCVMIGPGGLKKGEGSQSYADLSFRFVDARVE